MYRPTSSFYFLTGKKRLRKRDSRISWVCQTPPPFLSPRPPTHDFIISSSGSCRTTSSSPSHSPQCGRSGVVALILLRCPGPPPSHLSGGPGSYVGPGLKDRLKSSLPVFHSQVWPGTRRSFF